MYDTVTNRMNDLKSKQEKAFVAYFMAGYPTCDCFEQLLVESPNYGADIIEVGVPFTDPIADGLVIQEAGQSMLAKGVSLETVIAKIKSIRNEVKAPIVIMSYLNPIVAYGLDKFANDIKEAGISGVIVPDNEVDNYSFLAKDADVENIRLIAPNTPTKRIHDIAKITQGFLYAVSLMGITGSAFDPKILEQYSERIRSVTDLPICAGFGISTNEKAKIISRHFDGVICGTALITEVKHRGVEKTLELISQMKEAIN